MSSGSSLRASFAVSSTCPRTDSAVTVIRFWVSVPVLSTHSTVVSPSVSMAFRRRVNTRWPAMRRAPKRKKDDHDDGEFLRQYTHRQRDARKQARRAKPPRNIQ